MKKGLLYFALLLGTSISQVNAQDVELYRVTSGNVNPFTYSTGDIIRYYDVADGAFVTGSQNANELACLGQDSENKVKRRVQAAAIELDITSTSVSKIRIVGNSSGNSVRNLGKLYIDGELKTLDNDYTTTSTIANNSACDEIVVSNLNIPLKEGGVATTIRLEFYASTAGTGTPQNVRVGNIFLTPISSTPLDFLSFTAKPDALGKSVSLNWQTTNEVNTKEFTIEKRTDATEFAAIGTEVSKNTAGVHNYSFTDNNVTAGNAYYRLKQVDNDGKYKYSDIAQVSVAAGLSLSIYPNPTDGILNVAHATATKASVKVLSLEGKSLVNQKVAEGATSTKLNISNLAAGAYVLVYENAGQQSTTKFVKK